MEQKVDIQLKKLVENIEALESEKQEVSQQISEVYKEAKSSGFSVKVIKKIVAMRKLDDAELMEEEHLTQLYKEALNMSI